MSCPARPTKTDRILAGHYGLTAEELDFILNYDIQPRKHSGQSYRLGRDAGEEGGGEE